MGLSDYLNYYGGYSLFIGFAILLSFLVAIVGAFVVYFVFLSPRNEGRYSGFIGWLYDFLSFKKLLLEPILKIGYLFLAIYLCVGGILTLFSSPLTGLLMITLGNILARMSYEFLLMLVMICKNTTQINERLNPLISHREFANDFGFEEHLEHHLKAKQEKQQTTQFEQNTATSTSSSEPSTNTVNIQKETTTTSEDTSNTDTQTPTSDVCPKCGAICLETALFCTQCGAKRS